MPQQDQHATELHPAEEVESVSFPAAAQTTIVLQPGEQPLDLPATQIAREWPSILRSLSFVLAVRRDPLDSMLALQPLVQGVAIVTAIPRSAASATHLRGVGGAYLRPVSFHVAKRL